MIIFRGRYQILKEILQYVYMDKAIPVRGCGGPQGCETSRLPHFISRKLAHR
jgi:hypothetical protein